MSILAAIKGAQLGAKIIPIALAGLAIFLSYQWGRAAKGEDIAILQAKLAKEYAGELSTATGAAYARGRDSLKQEIENNAKLEDIITDAIAAEIADNLCVTADSVEQLQQLQ